MYEKNYCPWTAFGLLALFQSCYEQLLWQYQELMRNDELRSDLPSTGRDNHQKNDGIPLWENRIRRFIKCIMRTTRGRNCRTLAATNHGMPALTLQATLQFQMSMAPGGLCQFNLEGHGLRYSTKYKPGFHLDRIYQKSVGSGSSRPLAAQHIHSSGGAVRFECCASFVFLVGSFRN